MTEDGVKSRLKRIADMNLGDYRALQRQGFDEGLTPPEGGAQAAAKETVQSDTGHSRLQHLAGMTATDVRNIRFEETPPTGEAPSDYDLSG